MHGAPAGAVGDLVPAGRPIGDNDGLASRFTLPLTHGRPRVHEYFTAETSAETPLI